MEIYKGNVINGEFDYTKYYPASLDGKQILDEAEPNQCYMVLKTDIPEGKKINGLDSDNKLVLIDDPAYQIKQKQEALEAKWQALPPGIKSFFKNNYGDVRAALENDNKEEAVQILTDIAPMIPEALADTYNSLLTAVQAY